MNETLSSDYIRKDKVLRDSLADFGRQLFGIELFRRSKTLECNLLEYIPFSIVRDKKIIANISLGKVNLMLLGQERKAHIVQTVGVLPEFRGRGLIRELFKPVHEYLEARGGLSFLLAHSGVAQFYPRFGYERQAEYEFSAPVPPIGKFCESAQQVNLQHPKERQRFIDYAENRAPISKIFGIYRQSELLLWFCDSVYGADLSYLPELDCYVISRIEGNVLVLSDIIGYRIPHLQELYAFLGRPHLEMVRFGFTPDLLCARYASRINSDDDLFFIQGDASLPLPPFSVPVTSRG